jgi:hypothetical protein
MVHRDVPMGSKRRRWYTCNNFIVWMVPVVQESAK